VIELHSPDSEGELLFLKSLLDEAGIPYYVHNERFGSLMAGPQIAHYNRKAIWVHEGDRHEAAALIRDFLERSGMREPPADRRNYTWREKLRMVGEFLIFGWFLPGRRPRRGPELTLVKGFRTNADKPDEECGEGDATVTQTPPSEPR
jgi:hypothetical protein